MIFYEFKDDGIDINKRQFMAVHAFQELMDNFKAMPDIGWGWVEIIVRCYAPRSPYNRGIMPEEDRLRFVIAEHDKRTAKRYQISNNAKRVYFTDEYRESIQFRDAVTAFKAIVSYDPLWEKYMSYERRLNEIIRLTDSTPITLSNAKELRELAMTEKAYTQEFKALEKALFEDMKAAGKPRTKGRATSTVSTKPTSSSTNDLIEFAKEGG